MRSRDTSSEVQRMMDEHYLRMTPAEKFAALDDAWQTARTLALAGLRLDFPDETEEQLDLRWAERRLGTPLFERAMAKRRRLSSGSRPTPSNGETTSHGPPVPGESRRVTSR